MEHIEISPQSDDYVWIEGSIEGQSGYVNLTQRPEFRFDNGLEFRADTASVRATNIPHRCSAQEKIIYERGREKTALSVQCDEDFGSLWEKSADF